MTLTKSYSLFTIIMLILMDKKIYQFVKEHKVPVVVMHMDNEWATKVITDIYAYAEMQDYEDQFTIYIHTVNQIDKALKIINDNHFFGVYSDFITEEALQQTILHEKDLN